jgi:PhnB protein
MRIDFHINFAGQCQKAFEFYQSILGGNIELLTYENSPAKNQVPENWLHKIVHGSFHFNNLQIAGTDVLPENYLAPQGFQLLLQMEANIEAGRVFDALSQDGLVIMPLQKTFWTQSFGIVTDQFGITWEINSNEE